MNLRTHANKMIAAGLALAVAVPTVAMAAHPFTDVPDGEWYSEAVDWAYNNGITTGKTPTTFDGWATTNRYEVVTFLDRYDDNVVGPALDEIESNVDDIESNVATVSQDLANATRVYFARVADDGTVEKTSSAALTVAKGGTGYYDVTLPENADNCAVQVTGYANGPGLTFAGLVQPTYLAYEASTDPGNRVVQVQVGFNADENDGFELEVNDLGFAVTAYCSSSLFVAIDPGFIIEPILP